MVQLLTDLPSIWTTQAPHCVVSQPTWVPVRPSFSRMKWTRSVRSSQSPLTARPFTVSFTFAMISSSRLLQAQMHHLTFLLGDQPLLWRVSSNLFHSSNADSRRFCFQQQQSVTEKTWIKCGQNFVAP